MSGEWKPVFLAVLLLAGVILAAGCGTTPPSRFYLLSAMADREAAGRLGEGERLSVAVSVEDFPEYLNQSQIVTRRTANRLDLDEFHRWAEPLRENFTRVIGENLSLLLGTPSVTLGPMVRSRHVDYSVAIEVSRFDTGPEPAVRLLARWTVLDAERKPIGPVRKSDISLPAGVGDRDSLVAAQSEAVARLSREIAAVLVHLGNEEKR